MSSARHWPSPSAKNSLSSEGITSKGTPKYSIMALRRGEADASTTTSSLAGMVGVFGWVLSGSLIAPGSFRATRPRQDRLQQFIIAQFPFPGKHTAPFPLQTLVTIAA